MEIDVGGATLEIPDGASPEAIKKAVQYFRTTPEFDRIIDKNTGAPAFARMIVGSADEQDKMPNVKRFFPDAFEYGDGNYVYTDPGTGRPTLFNPEGLDVGDVAAFGREATQAVGAGLGATFGAAGGFVVGAPTGPGILATTAGGAAMGAGLGTSAGGQLFDLAANFLMHRIDTRSTTEKTLEAGADFFAGAVGQRAGEMLGEGVKRAVGGGTRAAKALADAFRRLRIEPPAAAVSGSPTVATTQKLLEKAPGSADIMLKQSRRVLSQTKAAAERLTAKFGQARTTQGAGETIKEAAKKAAERFGFRQEALYDEVFDMIGPDTLVAVDAIKALRESLEARLAKAPRSLGPALNKGLKLLRQIELDAASPEGLPFQALREVRTMIGKDIDAPLLAGSTSAQNSVLKLVYGALTEDMSSAAKATSASAAKKVATADRYTRFFMTTADKLIEKIGKMDADERAFTFAMQSAKDGGTALARMRRHFLPEEWDTVAASVLNRLGKATAGAQDATGEAFSVNTFLTNWNRLAPEAKTALFGGKRYAELVPELDTLVKVVGSLKEVEKATNSSNTAHHMIAWMTLQTLGGALGGLVVGEGDPKSAVVGALGTVVAPRVAAKLITNPTFVKWLTTPITSSTGISAHIGRLATIAVAEPAIADEIDEFVTALRSIPGQPGRKPR